MKLQKTQVISKKDTSPVAAVGEVVILESPLLQQNAEDVAIGVKLQKTQVMSKKDTSPVAVVEEVATSKDESPTSSGS